MSAELFLQSWGTYTEVKAAGFFFIMQSSSVSFTHELQPQKCRILTSAITV